MYKFLKASKDATIYRFSPDLNTGLDPILEVTKVADAEQTLQSRITRALIQFDVRPLISGSAPIQYQQAELLLTETESTEIPIDYELFAFPVAESWVMGSGRVDDETQDGVTWNSNNAFLSGSEWPAPDTGSQENGFPGGAGGIWNTSVSASQAFSYETADVNMDVTSIIDAHVSYSIDPNGSGSIENNGMMIKFDFTEEQDNITYGNLKFFSKETHTIYEPLLRVGIEENVYDQQKFISGSFQDIREVKVHANVKNEYFVDTTPFNPNDEYNSNLYRIDLVCRELYPVKLFGSFKYGTNSDTPGCFLPEDSYYRILDVTTDRELIPYSKYSKILLDQHGNFFNIDFTNWEVDRDYAIEIKVIQNGAPVYFNNKFIFTLTD